MTESIAMALDPTRQYRCQAPLNLYKTPDCTALVTQARIGRYLRPLPNSCETAVRVCLCEDDYPGWLAIADLPHLVPAASPYIAPSWNAAAIQARLPAVIAFTKAAMAHPNHYLWGGTLGPNYDCSGLIQTAFASVGIPLPRDSYQQAAFTQPIALETLRPGDLIFFGQPRINHVALYLGHGQYIHSSGQDQGRNGIGIDSLWHLDDPISRTYARQVCQAGRIIRGYQPSSL